MCTSEVASLYQYCDGLQTIRGVEFANFLVVGDSMIYPQILRLLDLQMFLNPLEVSAIKFQTVLERQGVNSLTAVYCMCCLSCAP
jgi:hypothetical protein